MIEREAKQAVYSSVLGHILYKRFLLSIAVLYGLAFLPLLFTNIVWGWFSFSGELHFPIWIALALPWVVFSVVFIRRLRIVDYSLVWFLPSALLVFWPYLVEILTYIIWMQRGFAP